MKEPKPRDRFIRALRLEKVDRVPRLYRMRRAPKEKIDRVFGISESETGSSSSRSLNCTGVTTPSFTKSASTPNSRTIQSPHRRHLAKTLIDKQREAWA